MSYIIACRWVESWARREAMWERTKLIGAMVVLGASATGAQAAVIFDDFNTSLGHFGSGVTNASSGSNTNMDTTSTHARTTTDSFEGSGSDKLNLVPVTAGSTMRLRHLSGLGSAANNTAFTTSSGVDGWIGMYLKTSNPGFTVQIYMEGAS